MSRSKPADLRRQAKKLADLRYPEILDTPETRGWKTRRNAQKKRAWEKYLKESPDTPGH